nr:2845_t:CDS:10 [Entrophospora candida]
MTTKVIFNGQTDNFLNDQNDIEDEPSIQYSTVKLDSQQQLFPSFKIIVKSNITINCKLQTWNEKNDCSANFEFFDYKHNEYYKFTPTEDMIDDGPDKYYRYLFLYWDNTSNLTLIEFGGELDDIRNNYPDQINLQNYIGYLNSNYMPIQENLNGFDIKWTRRNYLIRDWTNYLGFPNHYVSLRIAEPILSTYTTSYKNQTTIAISPHGYVDEYFETVETEKRFETVLSNIGSLGGAISLLLGVYAILFGGSLLSPWGIFQNYCCKYKPRSKRKLLNNLPVIPLTEKNPLQYENSEDPNIISIITRFNSLETILREYVINSDFLDELVETKNNKIVIDESNKPLV